MIKLAGVKDALSKQKKVYAEWLKNASTLSSYAQMVYCDRGIYEVAIKYAIFIIKFGIDVLKYLLSEYEQAANMLTRCELYLNKLKHLLKLFKNPEGGEKVNLFDYYGMSPYLNPGYILVCKIKPGQTNKAYPWANNLQRELIFHLRICLEDPEDDFYQDYYFECPDFVLYQYPMPTWGELLNGLNEELTRGLVNHLLMKEEILNKYPAPKETISLIKEIFDPEYLESIKSTGAK